MRLPEQFQPIGHGCVGPLLVPWEIALDIDDWCAVPEIETVDVQIATIYRK